MHLKLLLYILTSLFFTLQIQAADNSIDAARNLAKKYCKNPTLKKTGIKPAYLLRCASEEQPAYFIFSDNETDNFCIVDADGEKVLGYGDNFRNELPPLLQAVLDTYATSTFRLQELKSAKVRENIPALMNVTYGTRSPYNKFIPERNGSDCPVGCVPVTLAQICRFYGHPSKLMNDIPGYAYKSSVTPDTIYQIEGQKAEGRSYDWNLILNHYEKDTTEELNNEIAKLMWDCARSVETMFEQDGSAALTDMLHYSLSHYFGFNSDSLRYLSREQYYREEWLDLIHEELSKNRPVYMAGKSYTNGGHAFICDGYVDGYLHINWGWNGSSNGYFDADILDYKHNVNKEQSSPDNGYSFFGKIIIGIVPGEGKTEIARPKSANGIVQTKEESFTVDSRFRATETGFKMYTSVYSYNPNISNKNTFTIGYADKDGKVVFLGESESFNSKRNTINLNVDREFDNSFLGKDITLYILQSDDFDTEMLAKDTIYDWWYQSEVFAPFTVRIPDVVESNNNIIKPKDIQLFGEYSDSTIILNLAIQADKPEGSMRYYALALVSDNDTLMSTDNSHVTGFDNDLTTIQRSFKDFDMEKKMSLLVLQTDKYNQGAKLNLKEWSVCNNFEPISFSLSGCKIFSTDLVVDTIIHSTKGTTQRFEITFSNPSPFEFYNDIYFLVDNIPTGITTSIPAGATTQKIIERKSPLFTNSTTGTLEILSNANTVADIIFTKDTFSHVFYALGNGDETNIIVSIVNATENSYTNTFLLRGADGDTISTQEASVAPLDTANVTYKIPVIVSDTTIIQLKFTEYSIYDKDKNLLGIISPYYYQGKISQSLDDDKLITIDLWPVIDTILPKFVVGVAETLDDTAAYQRFEYTPNPNAHTVSLKYKLRDSCTLKNPKYIGLCKEDGTFYAYMKIVPNESGSSSDISSSHVSIISIDGGIMISSNVEIPSLSVYNVEGKNMKTVGLKPSSTLFVPLKKGIYIVGNNKVQVK